MQTPVPPVLLAHFLRQIESHHINTPTRTPLPLHYDATTQSLAEFLWPWNPQLRERVAPSQLEAFRRTHNFKAPCCLCAFLDQEAYTESRIGVVQTARQESDISSVQGETTMNGQYVAVCPKNRCGYFLCLERFYPFHGLKLHKYAKRAAVLPLHELNYPSDLSSYTRGAPVGGLRQILSHTDSRRLPSMNPDIEAARRRQFFQDLLQGISEATFWGTFVQCFVCKSVMLSQGICSYHTCTIAERAHKRFKPYPASRKASRPTPTIRARLLRVVGDVPEALPLRSVFSSSPTPTEIIPDSEPDLEQGDSGELTDGGKDELDDPGYDCSDEETEDDELPILSSDDLPTVLELIRGVR